jgi:RNA polymerase sigma-70 factor (ECF subfamily)
MMSHEKPVEALRRSAREPEAFVRFYDEHSENLLAYLARRVYEPEVAVDLTAEVFARAFAARARFRGSTDGQAAAWLYKIGRRELDRYFRRGHAERRALTRLGIQLPRLDEEQQARIEELARLGNLRGVLRAELERLSQAHREALRLRIVEELPYSEVASRLDISEQAARARVSRGLRALARALDRKNPLLVQEKRQ